MKAKLIKEDITEQNTEFSPSELYIVARKGDHFLPSLHQVDTIYTNVNDARPHALFLNSQGYKQGNINRSNEYTYYTIEELIDELLERS